MTTAVIVQARMGSSRLPGKIMKMLAGQTVLQHVLDRCRAIPGADIVVCAVPDESASRPIETVAAARGATVFRGSEKDVLARYLGAANAVSADIVMRVTSDCPLIDPDVCGKVLALRARESADYAANNTPRSFPHGLDCEAFTTAALSEAAASTQELGDREHVTPWIRRTPHLKRSNLHSGDESLSSHRWTLDYEDDLKFFEALFDHLPKDRRSSMSDALAVLAVHPEIAAINASHRPPKSPDISESSS